MDNEIECPEGTNTDDHFDRVYDAADEQGVRAYRARGKTWVTGDVSDAVAVALKASEP